MKKPYADEAPMRRMGILLTLMLAAIAMILAGVTALTHFWGLDAYRPQSNNPRQNVTPALETAPQPALQDYLAQKQHLAESYSWLDPEQELARIPVEQAMQALAVQSDVAPDQRAASLMGMTP